jgi:hypothetical protein
MNQPSIEPFMRRTQPEFNRKGEVVIRYDREKKGGWLVLFAGFLLAWMFVIQPMFAPKIANAQTTFAIEREMVPQNVEICAGIDPVMVQAKKLCNRIGL